MHASRIGDQPQRHVVIRFEKRCERIRFDSESNGGRVDTAVHVINGRSAGHERKGTFDYSDLERSLRIRIAKNRHPVLEKNGNLGILEDCFQLTTAENHSDRDAAGFRFGEFYDLEISQQTAHIDMFGTDIECRHGHLATEVEAEFAFERHLADCCREG